MVSETTTVVSELGQAQLFSSYFLFDVAAFQSMIKFFNDHIYFSKMCLHAAPTVTDPECHHTVDEDDGCFWQNFRAVYRNVLLKYVFTDVMADLSG